ncbi:MAG: hypothetical protein EOO14_07140 [Chitinophagaceae bacterium]|nr:MAG: hypothetical protein EOO14_07140 [Chitinophagaceae bacterium]
MSLPELHHGRILEAYMTNFTIKKMEGATVGVLANGLVEANPMMESTLTRTPTGAEVQSVNTHFGNTISPWSLFLTPHHITPNQKI